MDGEDNEEDMDDVYGEEGYNEESELNNFPDERLQNFRFAFPQQFYNTAKPQPDEVDQSKPFVLNFDSMYPIDSTRM